MEVFCLKNTTRLFSQGDVRYFNLKSRVFDQHFLNFTEHTSQVRILLRCGFWLRCWVWPETAKFQQILNANWPHFRCRLILGCLHLCLLYFHCESWFFGHWEGVITAFPLPVRCDGLNLECLPKISRSDGVVEAQYSSVAGPRRGSGQGSCCEVGGACWKQCDLKGRSLDSNSWLPWGKQSPLLSPSRMFLQSSQGHRSHSQNLWWHQPK